MKNFMKTALNRLDAWQNSFSGHGSSVYQKIRAGEFQGEAPKRYNELRALYEGSDLAATIVDAVVDEGMRGGYQLSFEANDSSKPADARAWAESRYNLSEVITQAAKWERAYGGSAVWVGSDLSNPKTRAETLKEEAQLPRDIPFVRELSLRELQALLWELDPASKWFRSPLTYNLQLRGVTAGHTEDGKSIVSLAGMRIHRSHLVVLPGIVTSPEVVELTQGWGLSVLQRLYDQLREFETSWSSLMEVLQKSRQVIYGVKDLMELLASENHDLFIKRMQMIEQDRGNMRPVVLDAESESLTNLSTPMGDLPQMLEKAISRIAAAARMPVTVLFGISPAGMNATGDSDMRAWQKTVEAYQKNKLGPILEAVYREILQDPESPTRGKVPKDLEISFNDLWTPSAIEQSQLYAQQATADVAYIVNGVLLPEEVGIYRAENPDSYGFPEIDVEARKELIEAEAASEVADPEADLDGDGLPDAFSFWSATPPPQGEDAVQPKVIAAELGVPTRTVTAAVQRGELTAWKVLNKVLLSRKEVINLVAQQNSAAESAGNNEE